MVVFYGSQTGTAEEFATRLCKEARYYGISAMSADPIEYDVVSWIVFSYYYLCFSAVASFLYNSSLKAYDSHFLFPNVRLFLVKSKLFCKLCIRKFIFHSAFILLISSSFYSLQETLKDLKDIEDHISVFLMATYGEGEPTDNAIQFWEFIKNEETDLEGLNYAVGTDS